MSYKPVYPKIGDEILPFDKSQEDRTSSAINQVVTSGSSSNGTWVKYSDGTMIIYHSIILNYVSSAYVQSKWDFPVKFIDNPRISGGIRFGSAGTPAAYIGGFGYWSKGADHCFPRVYSTNLSFKSGDSVDVDIVAMGRWK